MIKKIYILLHEKCEYIDIQKALDWIFLEMKVTKNQQKNSMAAVLILSMYGVNKFLDSENTWSSPRPFLKVFPPCYVNIIKMI